MDRPTSAKSLGEKVVIDQFVNDYLAENPKKTKMEALQEWNRDYAERSKYVAGFTGNTSLSRLPADVQRNILTKTPGGRYSVATAKQGNRPDRLEVSIRELCEKPPGIEEFKRYILNNVKNYLRDVNKLSITYISGYGMKTKEEQTRGFRPKSPEKRDEAEFREKYKNDRRLPQFTNISISFLPSTKQFKIIISRKIFVLTGNGLHLGDRIESSENAQLFSLLDYFKYDLFDNLNFPDSPNVYTDKNTMKNILGNRLSCKYSNIDHKVSQIFVRYNIVDDIGKDIKDLNGNYISDDEMDKILTMMGVFVM